MAASRFGRRGRLAGAVVTAFALIASLAPGTAAAHAPVLDAGMLRATLDATRAAGMYGLYSAVRSGGERWDGASGVADVRTRRPVSTAAAHRVGGVTTTFTATAVMQQVEQGRIALDGPIGTYLPDIVPGVRGGQITVRMLLNHTSGLADYLPYVFPSVRDRSTASVDAGRYRRLTPEQLISYGVQAPPVNAPGERSSYSNTNYLIAGRLLEKVTGERAEDYITRHVIRPAGLRHTAFPTGTGVGAPHARMYESLFGGSRPPRDYSTYDMSYAWTAGALVSTMDDLSHFYRALFTGRLVSAAGLAEMRRTVPVETADPAARVGHGLGLASMDLPCGTFWGHDGAVFGAGTRTLSSPDGSRQIAVGWNLTGYQRPDAQGRPTGDPIDNALRAHVEQALCSGPEGLPLAGPSAPSQPLPLEHLAPRP